ncbi:MAG: hypothetical protein H0S85_05445 [Desulfovibrionaceae bacterium]|jgi:hypothetical protein|nr:hypothetical protein [Desulfovibrionaceae bacterium]
MAATVISMPGVHCAHYARGRCLREERSNPGLDESLRCTVLAGWVEALDSFVNQADRFGLDEDTAVAIWQRRLEDLLRRGPQCPNFVCGPYCDWPGAPCAPGDEDADAAGADDQTQVAFACAHSLNELCLLSLPRCAGVCAHFRPAPPADATGRRDCSGQR